MIKKKGNLFVIAVATLGMATNPVLLAISPNLYVVTALNLLIGFFTAGTMTVLLNYLLEVTPEDNRVIYIGIYNTLTNISLTISPIVAHIVLKSSNIYIALIIDGALRFIGSIIFFAQIWYHRQRSRDAGVQA
jgi:MFS family permease